MDIVIPVAMAAIWIAISIAGAIAQKKKKEQQADANRARLDDEPDSENLEDIKEIIMESVPGLRRPAQFRAQTPARPALQDVRRPVTLPVRAVPVAPRIRPPRPQPAEAKRSLGVLQKAKDVAKRRQAGKKPRELVPLKEGIAAGAGLGLSFDREELRRGVLLREILGKPVALREPGQSF